jgi:hypothetical protein
LADRQSVDCEDVRWTIVESATAVEVQLHGNEAFKVVEANLSWMTIFEAGLHPQGKDVARLKNGLRGYNGLDRILAVKTKLPMDRAIRQSKGKITPLSAGVVECNILSTNPHRDWEGCDVDDVDQEVEVACETYVCATINQRS